MKVLVPYSVPFDVTLESYWDTLLQPGQRIEVWAFHLAFGIRRRDRATVFSMVFACRELKVFCLTRLPFPRSLDGESSVLLGLFMSVPIVVS